MFFIKSKKIKEQQKKRKRYLYILMFPRKYCYVGQTVNIKRRKSEHRRAWREPFYMYTLNYIKGSRYDAEEYEYAWRYKAQQKGLKVYGSPDKYVVDPSHRMTKYRKSISKKLKFPKKLKSPKGIFGNIVHKIKNLFIFIIIFSSIIGLGFLVKNHLQYMIDVGKWLFNFIHSMFG